MKNRVPEFVPTLLLLFLCISAGPSLSAQVALDVKTPWGVKEKIRFAKQGVNAAIDASDWLRRTEFGEDYSLWLRSLQRGKRGGDSIAVRLDLEIRTPAFIGRGVLIAADRVEIVYSVGALDSLVSGPSGGIDRNEWLASSLMVDQVIGIAGELIPFPNALVRKVLMSAAHSLNRAPTDGEIVEGTLLGLKVVALFDYRLKKLRENS